MWFFGYQVKKAFFALVSNGVRAAPLWDSKKQCFVGKQAFFGDFRCQNGVKFIVIDWLTLTLVLLGHFRPTLSNTLWTNMNNEHLDFY